MAEARNKQRHQAGCVPYWLVKAGVLGRMSATQLAVYLAICACAKPDLESWPGRAFIARATGRSERTVTRAVQELVELGLLQVERQGVGRSVTTVFRLVSCRAMETLFGPDAPAGWEDEPEKVTKSTNFGGLGKIKGDTLERKTGHLEAEKVTNRPRKGDTPCVPLTGEQKEQQQIQARPKAAEAGTAAAGLGQGERGDGDAAREGGAGERVKGERGGVGLEAREVRRVLEGVGVTEPTLLEFLGREDLPVAVVREVVERCRKRGKGAGVIVLELRQAAVEGLRRRFNTAVSSEAAARADAAQKALEAKRAQEAARDRGEMARRLEGLGAAELAELAAEARRTAPGWMRATLARGDPAVEPVLRREMLRVLQDRDGVVGQIGERFPDSKVAEG